MASCLRQGLQTLFAAGSFAGAGFLFTLLDKDGFNKETKRHNLAEEELARQKEKFYEKEVKANDREQQLRREIEDANADLNATN